MTEQFTRIVIDLDSTLTLGGSGPYESKLPNLEVIQALQRYREMGFRIAIHTARNMKTHQSNTGAIVAKTVPVILDWLREHDVPYDEIWVGKPWCGDDGFYVDDRAIRPSEFVKLSYREIIDLLDSEIIGDG